MLPLPGLTEKGADIINWLDAGGTAEELKDLARQVPEWVPPETPPAAEVKQSQGFQFTSLSDLLAEPPETIDYIWDKTLILYFGDGQPDSGPVCLAAGRFRSLSIICIRVIPGPRHRFSPPSGQTRDGRRVTADPGSGGSAV